MKSARNAFALVLLVLIVSILACSAPKRGYSVDQIAAVEDLEELMYVQATVADPRFRLAKGLEADAVTDAQFAEFADMGKRLGATTKVLPRFSMGKGFKKYAQRMAEQSAELERLALAKDGKAAAVALGIKKTCAACHDDYR